MYKRKVNNQEKKYKKFRAHRADVQDLMKFGKYKYLTIGQIIDRNPQYIVWCIEKEFIIPSIEIIDILISRKEIYSYDYNLNKVKK